MSKVSLYRFYDRAGALLYVGITNCLPRRLEEHDATKPWHHSVTRITVEHHPDRPAAMAAERAAIQAEHPTHNVVHNRPGRALAGCGDGSWSYRSRRSGLETRSDLVLYGELECSSVVDDYYDAPGEEQLEAYVEYLKRHYPQIWASNAVPIYWSVEPACEAAPFQGLEARDGEHFLDNGADFLTHYTWPINAQTGARLNWYKLPVQNVRFPEFARALAWAPSALQMTCPLRSIITNLWHGHA